MKSSRFILTAMLAAALTGGVMTATDSMARPHFNDSGYGATAPRWIRIRLWMEQRRCLDPRTAG